MPVDVDAGPTSRLDVRADDVGVAAELGEMQDQAEDDRDCDRHPDDVVEAQEGIATPIDQRHWHGADVIAVGDQVGRGLDADREPDQTVGRRFARPPAAPFPGRLDAAEAGRG